MLECAVALALMVDVSGSVSPENYQLQRDGIATAFMDPRVQEVITNNATGIAVSLVEWRGLSHQVVVNWRILKTKNDARAFADAVIDRQPFTDGMPTTGLANAITVGVNHITKAPCKADKRVIDVSGDGKENVVSPEVAAQETSNARDYAESQDITVNGLPIVAAEEDVVDFYNNHVRTSNGFVVQAQGFDDFPRAIRRKLIMEIGQNNTGFIPEG